MQKPLGVYREILRLIRKLPKETRPYYSTYLRENFVNYREVNDFDSESLDALFHRAYNHSVWVLNKYKVDESAAKKLKGICGC